MRGEARRGEARRGEASERRLLNRVCVCVSCVVGDEWSVGMTLGCRNREPLINGRGEDVSVVYSVANTARAVLSIHTSPQLKRSYNSSVFLLDGAVHRHHLKYTPFLHHITKSTT